MGNRPGCELRQKQRPSGPNTRRLNKVRDYQEEVPMRNRKKTARVLATVCVLVFVLTGFGFTADVPKININTASAEELTQLKRVGPKYAEKIVAFREANGPFKSKEDLVSVPGIGQKTVEVNKDLIVVE